MEAPQRGRRERGRRRSGKAPRSSIPPEGPSLRAVWAPRASPPPGSRPPLYECGWALARLHWSSQGLRDRRSRDDLARSEVARGPLAPARRAPETRWLMSNFRSGGITIRPGVLQFALVGGNSATRCPADRGTGGPAPPFRGPGGRRERPQVFLWGATPGGGDLRGKAGRLRRRRRAGGREEGGEEGQREGGSPE